MTKTVAQAMTPDPVVVYPRTPIEEAIQILAERGFSGLPVVNERHQLVGVLSTLDILHRQEGLRPPLYFWFMDAVIWLENPHHYRQELHKVLGPTVADVMTPHPISIHPEASLTVAAHKMHQHNVRRLPVVNSENRVVGILTRGDIVRALAEDMAQPTES
ncbi:MAG: CBS domain-containing protein [Gloeomargarita sp. GMQP_bins_120]